jgi:hypothetical protein
MILAVENELLRKAFVLKVIRLIFH